jgi:putative acetyltransferase
VSLVISQDIDANHPPPAIIIRAIESRDDDAMAGRLSERVSDSLGSDPDSKLSLSDIYAAPRRAYFVIERDGLIVGGAGIAPLTCDFTHIAELQRIVLLPMSGQRGHARRLLDRCLDAAAEMGFRTCYAESRSIDAEMNDLLQVAGFQHLGKPLRDPTNTSCDTYHFVASVIPASGPSGTA